MKLKDYPEHAKQAHASVAKRISIGYEDFMRQAGDWECIPVNVDNEPVGALISSGPTMHACISRCYGRWLTRPLLKAFHEHIDKHEHVLTSVAEGNTIGDSFVRRLGFKEVKRERGVIHYEVRHGL